MHPMHPVMTFVGLPGIEPGLHAPEACVLPAYSSPTKITTPKRAATAKRAEINAKILLLRGKRRQKALLTGILQPGALYRIRTYDLSRVKRTL